MEAAGETSEAASWIKALLAEQGLGEAPLLRLRQLLAWLEEGDRSAPAAPLSST